MNHIFRVLPTHLKKIKMFSSRVANCRRVFIAYAGLTLICYLIVIVLLKNILKERSQQHIFKRRLINLIGY